MIRVENGFSTRTREAAELTGTDYYQNHEKLVREEKLRREAGFGDYIDIQDENTRPDDSEDDSDDK